MLYINTYLAPSNIHGIGLFSNQNIKQGEIIAKWNPNIDQSFSVQKYHNFSELEKEQLKKYARKDIKSGNIMLNADDTRFLNHSATPNIGHGNDGELFALKNIQIGEELTDNYNEIDQGFATTFL